MIQDYGFRLYNPSIGKFLSVDPLSPKYPELTPYQFASNRPIDGIDLDGLEFLDVDEARRTFNNLKSLLESQTAANVAASTHGMVDAMLNNGLIGLPDLFRTVTGYNPLTLYSSRSEQIAYYNGRILGDMASILIGLGEIGSGMTMTGGSAGTLTFAGAVIGFHGSANAYIAALDLMATFKQLSRLYALGNGPGGPGDPPDDSDNSSYNIDDNIKELKDEIGQLNEKLNKVSKEILDETKKLEDADKAGINSNKTLRQFRLMRKHQEYMELEKQHTSKTKELGDLEDIKFNNKKP